ncbi:alpha/beta fold hydrolase [Actinomadura rupiterrae]|uniref:alpha/beta fold hydrolase n=1 Tax=Actinomadura rupiterrae TaxID=559627 RepID=UPI0020A4D775|nr:alpha/beta hydrolase [Actinomadura rupiterrae]MCP2335381.1 pimeloyl-ACP methyl ester carboxylesterase [Actinomadura rupiterrae]
MRKSRSGQIGALGHDLAAFLDVLDLDQVLLVEFEQAAAAWDNEDWPAVTVHAYLHCWGEAPGDPAYDDIEKRLADPAPVRVPTLVIHGADDGDNLPETSKGKDAMFTAGYERIVLDDVGHFPPREVPEKVADLTLRHAERPPS